MWLYMVFVCLAAGGDGDGWAIRVWQSEEGLSNHNVTGVTQTPDGYLWIATRTTLGRFDGVQLEEYQPHIVFPGATKGFRAAAPSRGGGLWLAADAGPFVRLHGGTTTLIEGLPNAAEVVTQTIAEDKEGTLWVAFRGGAIGRAVDGRIALVRNSDGIPSGYANAIAADRNGRIWLAKNTSLGTWENERFRRTVEFPRRVQHLRLAAARSGGLWVCLGPELYRYEGGSTMTRVGRVAGDTSRFRPTVLLEDRTGAVWIGTQLTGLFRFDGKQFERIPVSDRDVNSLTEDREGNIWVGMAGGGLNRIQPRAFTLEATETGLAYDTVQSVSESSDGDFWGATQNGLLVHRTSSGWTEFADERAPKVRGVNCVAGDRKGAVWVGTNARALHRWSEGVLKTWGPKDGLEGRAVNGLYVRRNGDLLLTVQDTGSGGSDGLQVLREDRIVSLRLPHAVRRFQGMAEDANGDLWIGADNAVFRVRGDEVADVTPPGAPKKSIRSLHIGAEQGLWIGYAGGGLGRLKEGRFAQIFTEHGLPDFDVSQVAVDDGGWVWMASDRGVFKAREKDLDAVADGRAVRVQCVQYGRGQGLPNVQAKFGHHPTVHRSRDGRLWMPMRTTLVVIDPPKLREDLGAPTALLKKVSMDDRVLAAYRGLLPGGDEAALPAARGLRLPANHRRLDFSFTALALSAPENIRFRYRLVGLDETWRDASPHQREASYTRLAAGEYRFRIVAGDGAGTWSETGAEFAFTVAPFFWQTWWFLCATLAVFAFVVAAAVRYLSFRRLRAQLQVLQQQAAVDKERSRIARDIHDDLGGSLTHMTLLLELILRDRGAAERVRGHTEQGLATARKIIKSLDETVWAVNPRNDTLTHLINYIAETSLEFLNAAGVRCHVDLPSLPTERPVTSEVRHHLLSVVKEALNNVVRHADASEVKLHIGVSDAALTITVEDNGKGFAHAPDNALADGLKNMQHRMKEVGGAAEIASQPGLGTRIVFHYPWPGAAAT